MCVTIEASPMTTRFSSMTKHCSFSTTLRVPSGSCGAWNPDVTKNRPKLRSKTTRRIYLSKNQILDSLLGARKAYWCGLGGVPRIKVGTFGRSLFAGCTNKLLTLPVGYRRIRRMARRDPFGRVREKSLRIRFIVKLNALGGSGGLGLSLGVALCHPQYESVLPRHEVESHLCSGLQGTLQKGEEAYAIPLVDLSVYR
jgi:hypothetical protein